MGEPLLNFDPVMAAVRLLLDPNGMALAPRQPEQPQRQGQDEQTDVRAHEQCKP